MCHHEHCNIHSTAVRPQFSPPINCERTFGFFVSPTVTQVLYNKDFECVYYNTKNAHILLDVNVTKNINSWPHFFFFDEVVPCLAHCIDLRYEQVLPITK